MNPSTFGYAAAAANSNMQSSHTRAENGDWSSSRKSNGSTQTFRRPSLASTFSNTTNLQRDHPVEASSSGKYMPPHRNPGLADTRYTKIELLDVYRACHEAQDFQIESISDLFIGRWDPYMNENSSTRNRKDEGGRPEKSGTDICWNDEPFAAPVSSIPLTDDEKDLFTNSVNSVLKTPASRDSSLRERKTFVSNVMNHPRGFSSGSNNPQRPFGRRQDNTDSTNELNHVDDSWNAKQGDESTLDAERDATAWGAGLSNPLGSDVFGSSKFGTPSDKRHGLGAGRSESRFKNLMSREAVDDNSAAHDSSRSNSFLPDGNSAWRTQRPGSSHIGHVDEPFAAHGSAAIGGGQDLAQEFERGLGGLQTSQLPKSADPRASTKFGINDPSDRPPRQPHAEAMSPTNTDPYQGPERDNAELGALQANGDARDAQLHGLGTFAGGPQAGFGSFTAFGQPATSDDRSQNSSVNQQRPFGAITGLGAFPGLTGSSAWGSTHGTTASSVRDRAGFGENSVGSSTDVPISGLTGLGSIGLYNSTSGVPSSSGRGGSRLGSLFNHSGSQGPQRTDEPRSQSGHTSDDERALHRPDALLQTSYDEPRDFGREQYASSVADQTSRQSTSPLQPPNAQQKTMVMPDRIRWIYQDPQGNTQGPWSGLEMHDWYKAGFFSPELLVKKSEDTEYEPLAQLIRRIGNSREPFLVPQIGIPHGAVAPPAWSAGPTSANAPQPPFANNFPSFGTTLTADQQNALERRKQEEQYLMARQKEHLAQQQLAQRLQIHGQQPGPPQSQPQHASQPPIMPSPATYAQGKPGPFDTLNQARGYGVGAAGHGSDEDVYQRGFNERYVEMGAADYHFGAGQQPTHAQQVKQMTEDRERLRQEQMQYEQQQRYRQEENFNNQRLQEFQTLNSTTEHASMTHPTQSTLREDPRTLTEQVQQAVSAQQSPSAHGSGWPKAESIMAQAAIPASPLPAPAAQRNRSHVADALHAESRSRSQTGSLDAVNASLAPWASQPSEASKGPSLKEIQEAEAKTAAKAEAVAAEARRSALEREAVLQAQAASSAAAAHMAGLPSSSTWGKEMPASNSSTPPPWTKAGKSASTTPAAKSMAQIQKEEEARKKRLAAAAATALQQSAALGHSSSNNGGGITSVQAIGKRYAELASKASGPPSGAWATVGASGKVKPQPTIATAVTGAGSPARNLGTASAGPGATNKKPASGKTVSATAPSSVSAQDEFTKWAINELKHDLTEGVTAEDFVSRLAAFPADVTLVTEAVHGLSKTIGSRQFATEYLRRRKLAEKGIFEGATASVVAGSVGSGNSGQESSKNGGGWSEVAKKGAKDVSANKDDDGVPGASFKVVAGKKKGGKR